MAVFLAERERGKTISDSIWMEICLKYTKILNKSVCCGDGGSGSDGSSKALGQKIRHRLNVTKQIRINIESGI